MPLTTVGGFPVSCMKPDNYPFLLRQQTGRPERLYMAGTSPPPQRHAPGVPAGSGSYYICVVGSRCHTAYGRTVCRSLVRGLAGEPVVIVSGLAIGIDSIAHEAALEAGLPTVAFPGSGLSPDTLYPKRHHELAIRIIESGGALYSAFDHHQHGERWMFPERNALMAGVSHAVLVIEGGVESGTLITARQAAVLGRDVLVAPGSILSPLSAGPLKLMAEGAVPVASAVDIMAAMNPFDPAAGQADLFGRGMADEQDSLEQLTPEEQSIIRYLEIPASCDDLGKDLQLSAARVGELVAGLELKGAVLEEGGLVRRCG